MEASTGHNNNNN